MTIQVARDRSIEFDGQPLWSARLAVTLSVVPVAHRVRHRPAYIAQGIAATGRHD